MPQFPSQCGLQKENKGDLPPISLMGGFLCKDLTFRLAKVFRCSQTRFKVLDPSRKRNEFRTATDYNSSKCPLLVDCVPLKPFGRDLNNLSRTRDPL